MDTATVAKWLETMYGTFYVPEVQTGCLLMDDWAMCVMESSNIAGALIDISSGLPKSPDSRGKATASGLTYLTKVARTELDLKGVGAVAYKVTW
ncbi:hypothetical protein BGX38DRAFT_1149500 [Terfezia claveryi]|nr:hypothetical protein BGX38DRAFT_1149500 [Terfezia claveryi]